MKNRINLLAAKEIFKTVEDKLNKMYEDKASGKLQNKDFIIAASECAGLFQFLTLEMSYLSQDCMNLLTNQNKNEMQSLMNEITKAFEKKDVSEKDPLNIKDILGRGKNGSN